MVVVMRNFIQRVMDRQNIGVDDLNCIQRVMLKRDMNTQQLVDATGLSYTTAQNIATGKTDVARMRVERFLQIAHGLGMTADELYYGTPARRTCTDPRQREINDAYASVTEDGRNAIWTTAVMARATFPCGLGSDVVEA